MSGFPVRFVLSVFLLLTGMRVWLSLSVETVPVSVWLYGAVADFAATAMIGSVAVLACIAKRAWVRSTVAGIVIAVILIVATAEFFFWYEFQGRLDRLVFHYLAYPVEVLTFLEEQFYVKWIVVPLVLLILLILRALGQPPQLPAKVVAGVIGAGVIAGSLVAQPVVNQSRQLTQLASNGYAGVLVAARVNQTVWRDLYPGVEPAESTFNAQSAGSELSDSRYRVSARHVVLIIEESFAGKTWEDPAERSVHLPSFTALSEQGLRFDNVVAAGTRTTRGMESILHGFPPLPGISATERAGFERLPSLPRAFREQGYHTVFAYGGWPGFSNFTNYWHGIGFEQTTSRYDFPAGTFETSWGVSDRDLFVHILGLMDTLTEAPEPVFLATLTVSNHRPFVVPAGEPGSEERSLRAAMHYADASLGWFFAQAKLRPWFDDTVFVVVADHGLRIHGDSLVPVESYRVPLLILSPPEVGPAVITEAGGSAGIAATLMSMFGFRSTEQFWAPSLLDGRDDPAWVEHDYNVGALHQGRLTVLAKGGTFHQWHLSGAVMQPVGVIDPAAPEAVQIARTFSQAHAVLYPR